MANKTSKDIPNCNIIHKETFEYVKSKMPKNDLLGHIAEFFKLVGDQTRIKILYALFESPMCVCDIAILLNMSQSAISHQLRVLKQAGLVKYKKEGRVVFYSLDDDHVKNILDQGMDHINHR